MQQNIHKTLQQIMQKDMDRKDFIQHVGIGFVAIAGVTTALKSLSQFGSSGGSRQMPAGYGASAYGGSKLSNNTNQ